MSELLLMANLYLYVYEDMCTPRTAVQAFTASLSLSKLSVSTTLAGDQEIGIVKQINDEHLSYTQALMCNKITKYSYCCPVAFGTLLLITLSESPSLGPESLTATRTLQWSLKLTISRYNCQTTHYF